MSYRAPTTYDSPRPALRHPSAFFAAPIRANMLLQRNVEVRDFEPSYPLISALANPSGLVRSLLDKPSTGPPVPNWGLLPCNDAEYKYVACRIFKCRLGARRGSERNIATWQKVPTCGRGQPERTAAQSFHGMAPSAFRCPLLHIQPP